MKWAYYNENNPEAAEWLRELMGAGLIAPGEVDERSILEVRPHEISNYTQQHFFAGIGGWSLALRLAGWPDSRPVRTGSCPCQPFSAAGKQLAEKDERHLWPVFRDLITFGEPAITFGEQVASALGREWLAGVRADLEGLGHEVGAADLCAACAGEEGEGWILRGDRLDTERIVIGAPQIRQRLYWMAVAKGERRSRVESEREAGERERSRARSDCAARGGALGGMAVAGCERGQRWRRTGDVAGSCRATESEARERQRCGDAVGDCGATGGLEHAARDGRGERRAESGRRGAASGCGDGAGGLSDAIRRGSETGVSRPEQREERLAEVSLHGLRGGFWSRFDALPCTDGKARRVESGSFPLAHGIPGRVGLLRGYGNAIVPQLAAIFIEEALAAIGEG